MRLAFLSIIKNILVIYDQNGRLLDKYYPKPKN